MLTSWFLSEWLSLKVRGTCFKCLVLIYPVFFSVMFLDIRLYLQICSAFVHFNGFRLMFHFFLSVPVSKPSLWPLNSLVDRPTCWGEPVSVRCGCSKGTDVYYAWFQHTPHKDFLLHRSSDISFHCGTVKENSKYYCFANNSISSRQSDVVSVLVLISANTSCIYVVNIQGKEMSVFLIYNHIYNLKCIP